FLKMKMADAGNGEITLTPQEIIAQFEKRPSYTKDYEDKLFEYDKYTAITTAGYARLNGKRIYEVLDSIKKKHHKQKGYYNRSFTRRVNEFVVYLQKEVESHINTSQRLDS